MRASRTFLRYAPVFLMAILAGVGLILMVHESGKLFRTHYLSHLLAWAPIVLFLFAAGGRKDARPIPPRIWALIILTLFMVLALFSGWVEHRWFFFLRWTRPTFLNYGPLNTIMMVFVFMTALLTPVLLKRPRWVIGLLGMALMYGTVWSLYTFYQRTGWTLLIRDDHPSFAFRIWKFSETFPQILSYNPYWNGGEVQAYALSSGAVGPGLLMYPFLRFFTVDQIYTPAVGIIFVLGLPLLAIGSAYLTGVGRTGQLAAGLLALCVSHYYYLWLFTYGTLGANMAAVFVMPVAACLYRIFFLDRRSWPVGFILVISAVFLIMWPPGMLMGALLSLGVLVWPRYWSWPKWRFLLICAAVILAVQLRYYLVVAGSDVFGLIEAKQVETETGAHAAWGEIARAAGSWLRAHFRQANPLLLYLGLGGALVSPWRRMRRFFIPPLMGFAVVTGFGPELVDILQLERMILPMLYVAVLPAAVATSYLLRLRAPWTSLPRAAVVSLLILTGWNTQRLWNNEGRQRHQIASPGYFEMVDFIREEVPEGTRLLFFGATVHTYGGGHVAFLPKLTGREMMACDYYHFDPRQIEYNYPPRPWRDSIEAMHKFFRFYNVSMVTSHRNRYITLFRNHPEYFEEQTVGPGDHIPFFRVRNATESLFLKGSGKAVAHFNRIDVRFDSDEDSVIAYNWVDGLRSDPPVPLFPYEAAPNITLIGIRPDGQTNITIRYRGRP